MKPSEYIKKAKSVDTNYPNVNERLKDNTKLQALVHGALGMSGETGEVVDLIKKHLIFDKPLDETALKKELGDVLWYMAVVIDAVGSSFEEIMQMNSDKLDARYPNGFSEQAALARKDMKPASKPKYRVGDILRHDKGPTALFQVTFVSEDHSGEGQHRYYGVSFYRSRMGEYEKYCRPANNDEKTLWLEERIKHEDI